MVIGRSLYFKRIFVIIFILLILFVPSNVSAKLYDIISFKSYFDIDYDSSILNQELKINKSINIPLTIIYTSDLPEEIVDKLRFLTLNFMWRNKIIFNRSMIKQIVNINITNVEEITWAHITLTQNKIFIDKIPYFENEVRIKTSLIISPFQEAPAESETIKFKVSSQDLGILKGGKFEFVIQFEPRFTPFITITPEESLQLTTPREPINYKILIKNHSNKRVRIDSEIINNDSRWYQTINPESVYLDSNDTTYFIFSAKPPYEIGWHDRRQEFKINVHAQIFPIKNNNSMNRSYNIILKANNYGFSTPGFTILSVISAVILFFILRKINFYPGRGGK